MQKTIIQKMLEGDKLDINEELLPFFDAQFKNWYNAIKQAEDFEWEISIDSVKLAAEYLNIGIDEGYPEHELSFDTKIEHLLDVVTREFEEKYAITRLKNLTVQYETTRDVTLLDEIAKITQRNKKVKSQAVPLADYEVKQLEFIRRVRSREPLDGLYIYKYGHTSQFKQLSRVLNVIAPSEFIIIGARPSVGKTAFGLSLANVLCKNGYRGIFFSMEMRNEELLNRMAVAKSGVPNDRLFGETVDLDTINLYEKGLKEVSQLPLMVVDKVPSTWLEIKSIIMENLDNIDFIMLDYIGLISSFDGRDYGQSIHTIIGNVSKDMKKFAKEHGKPIIALAQLNRNVGSESKKGGRDDDKYAEPFMRDLRDSGNIEQDVDKVILLYRKYEEKSIREKHEASGIYTTNVKIEKNRSGRLATLEYEFNGPLYRWKEVNKE